MPITPHHPDRARSWYGQPDFPYPMGGPGPQMAYQDPGMLGMAASSVGDSVVGVADMLAQAATSMTGPPVGGAASSPTPQERNQRGMGYRLNPGEQNMMHALMVGVRNGLDPQIASEMAIQTVAGATDRRQSNIAARREGMMGLQEMAMQLAGQGADPTALAASVSGMAENLPGMNGPRGDERMSGLVDYVYSMYPQGEISGMAPYDYRQQFAAPDLLDQEDVGAVGTTVAENQAQGIPFVQTRDDIRREMVAGGYSFEQIDYALQLAEQQYALITGVDLGQQRALGDELRGLQSQGDMWKFFQAIDQTGNPDLSDRFQKAFDAGGGRTADITELLAGVGQDPEALRRLLEAQPGIAGQEQSSWQAFTNPGNWFFMG